MHRLRQVRQGLPGPASGRPVEVRSAECTACLECVAVCPAQGALQLSLAQGAHAPQPRFSVLGWKGTIAPWAVAACLATIFLGLVGYARISGHWQSRVPNAIYLRLVPNADLESHPGM